jgi:hypothetical protein
MITQLLAHSGSSNRLNPCICALDVAYNTPVFITLRNISNDCLDDAASSSSSSFCNDNLNLAATPGGGGVWNSAYMSWAVSARVGLGRDDDDVEVAIVHAIGR